ncbi:unnamed protein product [Heligmosomoides polygyrus]|uniref:HTH_Tnp_Tc3_1 domain-containing protein n=1 Tax=Heligmosomoides polygyrus TaxID=6339 RepID=A0A183FJQ8_HELPZ|nr:unnamed protein product [Heligmosomoides polygyrus]
MAKNPKLSTCEQAQFDALHGLSNKKIAAQPGMSLNCINRYLKETRACKRKSKAGRPRKLSARDESRLLGFQRPHGILMTPIDTYTTGEI